MKAAEHHKAGDCVVWREAPRVVAPQDMPLMFVAPGNIGQIDRIEAGRAIVKFRYRTPLGRIIWSDELTVIENQVCDLYQEPTT